MTIWRVMFLAEKYGRMTLTLDEVAEQIGMAANTIRNRRARGEFAWLRGDDDALCADVIDVAHYIGAECARAKLLPADFLQQERQRQADESAERRRSNRPRRMRHIRRIAPWADTDAIRAIYAEAGRLTKETGTPHVVDHIIPLRGEMVSGLHVHDNLRVITAAENGRKHNRFEVDEC